MLAFKTQLGGDFYMKETKKEWKNPEIAVLYLNMDTEGGFLGSSDGFDIGS
jgi:hypothetical protein